jgi:hypothetical protein
MALRHFVDGDCICIMDEDFINLQESPAVFVLEDSITGRYIERHGLSDTESCLVRDLLNMQGVKQEANKAMTQVLHDEIDYLRGALAEARATITELRKETESENNAS